MKHEAKSVFRQRIESIFTRFGWQVMESDYDVIPCKDPSQTALLKVVPPSLVRALCDALRAPMWCLHITWEHHYGITDFWFNGWVKKDWRYCPICAAPRPPLL